MDQRLEMAVPSRRLHAREEHRRRFGVDAQPADERGQADGPLDARTHAGRAALGAQPEGFFQAPGHAINPWRRRPLRRNRHVQARRQNASRSRRPGATGASGRHSAITAHQ
jgi:hypothetical protein